MCVLSPSWQATIKAGLNGAGGVNEIAVAIARFAAGGLKKSPVPRGTGLDRMEESHRRVDACRPVPIATTLLKLLLLKTWSFTFAVLQTPVTFVACDARSTLVMRVLQLPEATGTACCMVDAVYCLLLAASCLLRVPSGYCLLLTADCRLTCCVLRLRFSTATSGTALQVRSKRRGGKTAYGLGGSSRP